MKLDLLFLQNVAQVDKQTPYGKCTRLRQS